MALYRHNATGFIGEFATNPGAGYTAISSMPTTSIAARANWWRGIDTYGQTSDWHPSVDDDAEDPNDNYLALVFTNEAALVSADADGNVTDGFLGATTQVRVMRGSRNVTESEGWSLGLGKSPDVPSFTYTWTGTDYKTLQITGFPVDETSGYIRITAVRSGSQTLEKDFKFLKVIKGEDGGSGVVIDLSNESHVVPTDGLGNNGNFTGCVSTASIYLGSSNDSANWSWTATPSGGVTGTATNSNRTFTVSAMSTDVGTVTFTATKTGFPNQTAVFSISKAKGGIAYQIEPSVGAINKSSAGAYTPSAISFSSYRTTTTTREAFSAYFYIERQSSLGGAWSLVYQSSTPQTSYSYSIPSNTFGVRGAIYLTAGQFLDVEAVPVVMDGASGERGSRQFVFNGTSWSDTAAWDGVVTATGGNPVLTDLVTIANASAGFSQSKFCTANTSRPGTWVQPDSYINGNLLVTGTVGANKLVANSITASQIASNTITTAQLSFTPVQSTNVVASINASSEGIRITGNRITLDGTVSFGVGYDPTGKIALGGAAADVNNNVTTISGGKITTGSITAAQLNFAPVTTSNVVASINATAEGIRISGSRITLDGTVSFGAGYDPTTKIAAGGAATDINNNVTTISGGKITTGSLNADRIEVGTITADRITIGGVTTDRIASGAVTSVNTGGSSSWSGLYPNGTHTISTINIPSVSAGTRGTLLLQGSIAFLYGGNAVSTFPKIQVICGRTGYLTQGFVWQPFIPAAGGAGQYEWAIPFGFMDTDSNTAGRTYIVQIYAECYFYWQGVVSLSELKR